MVKKKFFNPYKDKFVVTGEFNDGINHPDFDPDQVTDIVDYYRRFAADPEFTVKQLPPVYDDDHDLNDSQLLDLDEPEFGEQDLEYFGDPEIVERAKNSKRANQDEDPAK